MNRADEGALSWALFDSATAFLKPAVRASLCSKIGAGEQESAIKDLLVHGERESFVGGYSWQRSGPAVGSPRPNVGGGAA